MDGRRCPQTHPRSGLAQRGFAALSSCIGAGGFSAGGFSAGGLFQLGVFLETREIADQGVFRFDEGKFIANQRKTEAVEVKTRRSRLAPECFLYLASRAFRVQCAGWRAPASLAPGSKLWWPRFNRYKGFSIFFVQGSSPCPSPVGMPLSGFFRWVFFPDNVSALKYGSFYG